MYTGFPLSNGLSVYRYDATGALSYIATVPNSGNLICWLACNAAGTVLYSSETGTGTVSAYDISHAFAPVLLQHFSLTGSGNKPSNLAFDPTGPFLYVLSGLKLHVVNLDNSGLMGETVTPITLPAPTKSLSVSPLSGVASPRVQLCSCRERTSATTKSASLASTL